MLDEVAECISFGYGQEELMEEFMIAYQDTLMEIGLIIEKCKIGNGSYRFHYFLLNQAF